MSLYSMPVLIMNLGGEVSPGELRCSSASTSNVRR